MQQDKIENYFNMKSRKEKKSYSCFEQSQNSFFFRTVKGIALIQKRIKFWLGSKGERYWWIAQSGLKSN